MSLYSLSLCKIQGQIESRHSQEIETLGLYTVGIDGVHESPVVLDLTHILAANLKLSTKCWYSQDCNK
jgi:hypothetical protein